MAKLRRSMFCFRKEDPAGEGCDPRDTVYVLAVAQGVLCPEGDQVTRLKEPSPQDGSDLTIEKLILEEAASGDF